MNLEDNELALNAQVKNMKTNMDTSRKDTDLRVLIEFVENMDIL